jgi:pSer/pThr/pTyr-binding forkhead associated (FHA) protein
MRVGSLEVVVALIAFGLVAARFRPASALSRAKAMTLTLLLRDGAARMASSDVTVTVEEAQPCVIGRSSQAGIELADPEVSRRHARLELVRGVLYVADLGSSNGTFLNGKALGQESIEVRPGDDIDVGNTRITVTGMAPAL